MDPDIFENLFDTASFAPKRANRAFYSNAKVDELIRQGRSTLDREKRKEIYGEMNFSARPNWSSKRATMTL